MRCIYRRLLKEGNGDHNYLRCPDLQDTNFYILRSATALENVHLTCAKKVKAKSNINYSDFINYSNTISFYGNCLDKCGYFISQ